MVLNFDERLSDSPFVDRIWRSYSEHDGTFVSIASSQWEMVVTKVYGKTMFTVRGPETKATPAYCQPNGEWLGIRFKMDAFMPHMPAYQFMDRRDLNLPEASSQSFWLDGSAWQFPDYENADTFVARLVHQGLLMREPVVHAALHGQLTDLSLRSAQRRFLNVTGLTHSTVRQIERARYATLLLQQGYSILDTVEEAGYFDQPHLTRSLKHYVGQTPAQLLREPDQLSFLYKTVPDILGYDTSVQLAMT